MTVLKAAFSAVIFSLVALALYSIVANYPVFPAPAVTVVLAACFMAMGILPWLRNWKRGPIFLSLLTVVMPFYVFEGYNLYNISVGSVGPSYWEIMRHRSTGIRAYPYMPPMAHFVRGNATLLVDGTQTLPLFSIGNVYSVLCREGDRPYAKFTTDRYGYNNPDGIWTKPIDVVALGDSFTVGACVDSEDHHITRIRSQFPRFANLGASGSGPVMQIAILREFLQRAKPKIVIWFYDEHNDVFVYDAPFERTDLFIESSHSILSNYLASDTYSQNLLNRTKAIDQALMQRADTLLEFYEQLAFQNLLKDLSNFFALHGTRNRLSEALKSTARISAIGTSWAADSKDVPGAKDSRMALFRQAVKLIMKEVKSVGAQFVVVRMPANVAICDNRHHELAGQVKQILTDEGAIFLDAGIAMRAATTSENRHKLFALYRCGGHYSEFGYRILGKFVTDYLTAVANEYRLEKNRN